MPHFGFKFTVSAPGKVILFGEHSVVYGKPALAASINKRSTLVFEAGGGDFVEVNFVTLNLSLSVPLGEVQKILQKFQSENRNSVDYHVAFNEHLVESAVDNFQLLQRTQKVSIFCFFYLLYRYSTSSLEHISGFKVTISSDLAIGAGTGSSASFSVCLAAAFHHYIRFRRSSGGDEAVALFTAQDKKIINDYAFACEQIIHGRASGIDNFVCTYGSIVEMVSGDDEKNNNKIFRVLDDVSTLRIFLVNTGISRSTARLVQLVRDLHSRNTQVVSAILDAMGWIATSACSVLTELKNNEKNSLDDIYTAEFRKLEDLVSLNHGLLATLGVSHDSLNTIVSVTKKYDLHSKITGAGGGGFAFTLIPPYKSDDVILDCKHELEENGFIVDDITIGGTGVDIIINS